ncbi:MAG: VCBS repeat-containing protein [Acidobacteria bacterium]|nr:VCBS repeat-containing protein [Acidobacteriota bacterium]
MPISPASVSFDFDGDGKADIGTWRGSSTEFKVRKSSNGSYQTASIGSSTAIAAPGDFDGDGMVDAAVFNGGTWTIKKSSDSQTITVSLGQSGDIPAVGDFDGDGIADPTVYRPSNGTWYIKESSTSNTVSYSYGASTDIPVAGDYDGDGVSDFAVYRPSTGVWWIMQSSNGEAINSFGAASDVPVHGDFDGDGADDIAVFRPSTGVWWILKSSKGFEDSFAVGWGNWGDQPAPADYDGDGITDFCVWRPTTGVWHILRSSDSDYDHHTLGVAGDYSVPSAFTKQVGYSVSGDVLADARSDPRNRVGGTDLFSQNFSWSTQLAGLPGRSGLDAGFGISYNSLIWLKVGSAMYFDPDRANVAPGFRLGYSVIEPVYYDATKSRWVYMMIAPSGARTEFRQTTASNVYETADSSYARLVTSGASNPNDPVENISIVVTNTNGTNFAYEWKAGAFRLNQIKDSNGNYITVDHNSEGLLTKVTDTLGREINVVYDAFLYPIYVTQTRRSSNGSGSTFTHTLATFHYTTKTVETDFDGSITAVFGPPNSSQIKVLDKLVYDDGSTTQFEYNDYLQVKKIINIAADSPSHILNYVSTDLAAPSADQTDCPRFSEIRSWTENFNQDSYGTAQEVVTNITRTTGSSYSLPDSISGTATRIDVAVAGHPDGHISRNYFIESGWAKGLPVASEDCLSSTCTGTDRTRWSWTSMEHDGGSSIPVNPRVVETRVGDGASTKRTTIDYVLNYMMDPPIVYYGLVSEVNVFDADLNTVLKRTQFEYNLSSAYLTRRIIGLPTKVEQYGRETSGLNLMSKVTFGYDEGDFSDSGLQQNISPVQHDGTNFGSGFILGRGNRTSVTRWDVNYPTNSSYAITSSTKYNTAGSPVAQIGPWDGTVTRTVKIGYLDNFNSSPGVSTWAYPTTVTDPNDQSSTVKYRYDIGANVEAVSPAPAGNSYGKTTKRIFDSIGRVEKESVFVNTAEQSYTRFEYPTSGIHSKVFATVIDTNSNGPDAADEVLSETWTDGAGRVRFSRVPHTFDGYGQTATWAATVTEYDMLGRVSRQSVPTEVNGSFEPTGDDLTRGWLWSRQEYDWMGRVVKSIPTDSSGADGKETLISYEGCGCAGGLVTTVQGPLVPRDDDPQTNARRKQKSYEDILGRAFKAETYEWDGTTVYSTVVNTYNGRDQAVLSRQYAGTTSSETYQDTTASYDGHGRTVGQKLPQQDSPGTVFTYNPDGSVLTRTDARGVVTNYEYNNRGLVTGITWNVGSTGVTGTAAVEMQYDNLGNRTEMTDGLGTQVYEYDELSRLTAESRDFSDTLPDEPSGGLFTLTYTYEIGGQLRSYTDPWGKQISYMHDKTGRLNEVTGTPHGGVSSYATNAQYRAWGGLKHLEYGNGVIADTSYDSTLKPSTFDLKKPGDDPIMEKSYQYYNDGRLKHVDDAIQGKFDRLQTYDFAGRVKEGLSSTEANGVPVTTDQNLNLPYRQSFSYDAFNNMTQRNNLHWGTETWQGESNNLNYTFTNNRIAGFQYDADGRILQSAEPERATDYTYDARGLMTRGLGNTTFGETDIERTYSGDGRELKRKKKVYEYNEDPEPELEWKTRPDAYYIRSTVFGGEVISETHETGLKLRTFVYAAGIKIATQIGHSHPNKWVVFSHHDAAKMSHRGTYQWGNAIQDDAGLEDGPAEKDPMGNNAGLKTPYVEPEPPPEPPPIPIPPFDGDSPMFVNGQAVRATLDGVSVSWNVLMSMANAGGLTHMGHPVDVRVGQMVIPRIVEGPNPNRWEDPRMAMVMRYEGDWVISVAPPNGSPNVFGIWNERRRQLDEALRKAQSPECEKAFRNAGVETASSQIMNGLTIVSENMVRNARDHKQWGPKEGNLASQMRQKWIDRPTTNDVTYVGPYSDRMRYLSLAEKAFAGKEDHFSVVLVHSLVHSGGKKGALSSGHFELNSRNRNDEPIPQPMKHDLEYMGEAYDAIIANCTIEGKSKLGNTRGTIRPPVFPN